MIEHKIYEEYKKAIALKDMANHEKLLRQERTYMTEIPGIEVCGCKLYIDTDKPELVQIAREAITDMLKDSQRQRHWPEHDLMTPEERAEWYEGQ